MYSKTEYFLFLSDFRIMSKEKEWFENWFDTSFYHILYDYRNDDEARVFMNNLTDYLKLKSGDTILDLPCGKGRHSLYLNKKGFDTTGADISENSIAHARQFEKPNLRFKIHDMRNPLSGKYHAIFNLFTSFGYFNNETTNIKVLKNFKNALRPDGHIIVDFLNLTKVKNELIPEQQILKEGIEFNISKNISENFIIKKIEVNFEGMTHYFMEKVQALDLEKMKIFAKTAGLQIEKVFGDYELNPFDKKHSDRLILVMK
ncbi:class I SAM-dependent methyltransferase [Lutimonas zeaxanthinifaciens]|uniref:class I SAM-dependent methyltransferase n=1 Tax=Lutimonas zeaxanthinifaciens TaxID=3060215 RepID=UPI00265CC910|nr:class I SAM-dependent methyltransferase [Lutimonas sp. YSD2104]WKK67446.1 class I SAM-dependent methyltransferase [Lutimonas sp. YSD2104]